MNGVARRAFSDFETLLTYYVYVAIADNVGNNIKKGGVSGRSWFTARTSVCPDKYGGAGASYVRRAAPTTYTSDVRLHSYAIDVHKAVRHAVFCWFLAGKKRFVP